MILAMTNHKIKIGKPEISDEKIQKHKDFKILRANYDKAVKPLYKTPLYREKKAFLVLLIILLLTYVIAELVSNEKENEKEKTEQHDKK